MGVSYLFPEFEVVRNPGRCTTCRLCEQQCPNGVHRYNAAEQRMDCDEAQCVNCQRCVSFCPTHALKIVKTDCVLRENDNWKSDSIREI